MKMEHISKHLTVSNQETRPYSTEQKGFLPEESKILDLKYKAPPFGRMSPDQLKVAAHVVLVKLHVITGWNMPASGEYLDILLDQFEKKLSESYALVNVEEMECAFRNNPGVKDWGKAMNLNLIDEVMVPYLERRAELSRQEERVRPLQALGAPQISDEEFILSVKRLYWMDGNWRKIPLLAYKVLAPALSEERKEEIKEKVRAAIGEGEDFKDRCRQYAVKLYFDELE